MISKIELIKVLNNSKTKKSVKEKLGLSIFGSGTEKLKELCDSLEVKFDKEFRLNIKKFNNCKECGKEIKLSKKFCDSSCSATFNNKKRTHSEETKNKTSETLKNKIKNGYVLNLNKHTKNIRKEYNYNDKTKEFEYNCITCGKKYHLKIYPSSARKTCSRECQTKAIFKNRSYQNGSRKTFKYYNKFINKEVVLESSWEVKVAELLDKKNIHWDRPKSLDWIDENGVVRQYYSDFYLKDYDLYLDPKNPYCMKLDKVKLSYIEERHNIEYGPLKKMFRVISNLTQ